MFPFTRNARCLVQASSSKGPARRRVAPEIRSGDEEGAPRMTAVKVPPRDPVLEFPLESQTTRGGDKWVQTRFDALLGIYI